MNKKYEEVAFGLELYEVGELVETSDGYYVIMRVDMVREEVQSRVSELLSQYQYAVVKKAEMACEGQLSFLGNDYFKSLNLIDIK